LNLNTIITFLCRRAIEFRFCSQFRNNPDHTSQLLSREPLYQSITPRNLSVVSFQTKNNTNVSFTQVTSSSSNGNFRNISIIIKTTILVYSTSDCYQSYTYIIFIFYWGWFYSIFFSDRSRIEYPQVSNGVIEVQKYVYFLLTKHVYCWCAITHAIHFYIIYKMALTLLIYNNARRFVITTATVNK